MPITINDCILCGKPADIETDYDEVLIRCSYNDDPPNLSGPRCPGTLKVIAETMAEAVKGWNTLNTEDKKK